MIENYFANDATWRKYLRELESWKGTPYRHLQMVKQKGADCTLFIAATWLHMGILKKIVHDYYPRDWYNNGDSEMVLDHFYHHFSEHAGDGFTFARIKEKEEEFDIDQLMRGDMVCFAMNTTGITNHAGVYVESGSMIHCHNSARKGVTISQFGHSGRYWHRHLTYVFRIVKEI